MSNVAELFNVGMRMHEAGEIQSAQQIYETILQIDPRQAGAWYLLGVAAHQLGNQQLAIERLRSAIRLDPGNADFYRKLGTVYQDAGAFDAARLCFGRLIQVLVPPGHTADYLGLAGESLPAFPADAAKPAAPHSVGLYLELMKRCLMNVIYQDASEQSNAQPAYDARMRSVGGDWPSMAHTMIGRLRLDNVHYCVEDALARGVPGDLLEAGVWRGGTVIFMRSILQAYGVADRRVWVADSFAGVPPPNTAKYPQDAGMRLHTFPQLAVSRQQVQENFRRYGLDDDQVRYLQGWFRDTLPGAPIEQLAVLRIDGDLYESTMDVLESLYPKLARGGYVILDDFLNIAQVRQAAMDYRLRHQITDPILPVDWSAAFWRKS